MSDNPDYVELLPCPRCGEECYVYETGSGWVFGCERCTSETDIRASTYEAAMTIWNSRPPCPECARLRREIEALKQRNEELLDAEDAGRFGRGCS